MNKWIKIKDENEDEKLINLKLVGTIRTGIKEVLVDSEEKVITRPVIGFTNLNDHYIASKVWYFGSEEERDMKYKELKVLLGIKDE
jgi:hypothetical protein